jgi:hypothetical protein
LLPVGMLIVQQLLQTVNAEAFDIAAESIPI